LLAVHAANSLLHVPPGPTLPGEVPGLDLEYLAQVGCAARLPAWWELRQKIASDFKS
jgi:hypothetical protein